MPVHFERVEEPSVIVEAALLSGVQKANNVETSRVSFDHAVIANIGFYTRKYCQAAFLPRSSSTSGCLALDSENWEYSRLWARPLQVFLQVPEEGKIYFYDSPS